MCFILVYLIYPILALVKLQIKIKEWKSWFLEFYFGHMELFKSYICFARIADSWA